MFETIDNGLYYVIAGLLISIATIATVVRLYIKKYRPNLIAEINEDEGSKIEITKKEKMLNFGIFAFSVIAITVASIFVIPNATGSTITKELIFGLGTAAFTLNAILDLKYGEIYIFELSISNTIFMFILPIIVDLIFGCKCVAIALAIAFGVFVVAKMINWFFNKEMSIGGADVDTIFSLLLANVAIFAAMNIRENMPIFLQSFYFERIFEVLLVNFAAAIIIYFISKIIKKKKGGDTNEITNSGSVEEESVEDSDRNAKNGKKRKRRTDFRCLPAFVLIYAFTLFTILFY